MADSKITHITKISYNGYADFKAKRHESKGTGKPDLFRLGASDVGVVLGLSEWRSARAFFMEACDFYPSSFLPNPHTHRGHVQESVAYEQYWRYIDPENPNMDAYLHNYYGDRKVYRVALPSNAIYLNHKYDFIRVSPDFEIPESSFHAGVGLIEVKVPGGFVSQKYEAGIAEEYVAQCQAQLIVTEADYVELFSLDDATTFQLFHFELMSDYKDMILDTCSDFVQRVLKAKKLVYSDMPHNEKELAVLELAPPDTNPPAYSKFLKEWHRPENALAEEEGDDEQLTVLIDYLSRKQQLKSLDEETTDLENKIREWFAGGVGTVDFGSLGRVKYGKKLSVPPSILKNYQQSF